MARLLLRWSILLEIKLQGGMLKEATKNGVNLSYRNFHFIYAVLRWYEA